MSRSVNCTKDQKAAVFSYGENGVRWNLLLSFLFFYYGMSLLDVM